MILTVEEIDHFELIIGDRFTIDNTHAICDSARDGIELRARVKELEEELSLWKSCEGNFMPPSDLE